ncbi:MAG: hypothetical protein ACO388_05885 [Saprospiraceae bacterium]|jgi:hypothetical protein
MRKQIILSVIFSLALLTSITVSAQDYNSAIGGKIGYGLVGSYKTFLNEKAAVEAFAGINWTGLVVGGQYQSHSPISDVERLHWYWGGGAIFSTWSYGLGLGKAYSTFGVSGVIGLDYSIEDVPVNISLDWSPTIYLWDSFENIYGISTLNRFNTGLAAVSVRYILN